MSDSKKLRFITYLCPYIPVEVVETYMWYLSETLKTEVYLRYESRWPGPPSDREDPFTLDEVDIGFMCGQMYVKQKQKKNQFMELLPAAPIHKHAKSEDRPIYFADVIINAVDSDKKFKEFHDLKGCKWAYNDTASISGNLITLAELKKLGTDANFFGHTVCSGSHLNSIRMVLDKQVDAAAVDSNCLQGYFRTHPENRDKLCVLKSWGPIAIYPVVVNSRLPETMKKSIADGLLAMNTNPTWMKKLNDLGIKGFTTPEYGLYGDMEDLLKTVEKLSLAAAYY